MRIKYMYCSLLVAAISLGAPAGACELIWNETWKVWRGDCQLTIDPKGPRITRQVDLGRMQIKLPDLIIDKLKFRLFGSELEVYADIENRGSAASLLTTVGLNLTSFDPANPAASTPWVLGPATVPALAPMGAQRIFLGLVPVDNSVHDVEFLILGTVDPVTNAQPVRGRVIELIETNNDLMHRCRVYGPNSDQSVEPCN